MTVDTKQRYRARLSLGHFDSPELRDQAVFEAQLKLGHVASPEAPQRTIATDVLDIPANVNLITASPLTLDLDKWLYVSDLHVPLHNREWIRRLVLVASRHNVDSLIIGGDLFDFDSSSRHPKTQLQAGLNETLCIAGDLLVALCTVFDRVYVLPGNHCRRVANKLDEPLNFESLVYAALKGRVQPGRIICTNYDYIYVGQEDSGWVVGHPRYFSTIPAKGGAEVAMLQRRNVIGAHNHIVGLSQSKDGRFWSIDPGHMTDPHMTPYIMESNGLSKYPTWRNGFVLVNNNVPTMFVDGLIEWWQYGV